MKMLQRLFEQLTCLHIYDVKFIEKDGCIKLAEVCKYCGKTKIIC